MDLSALHRDVQLDGARTLVTGAGGDIGRAVALALSGLGSTVGLVGRTASSLEATAAVVPGPCHVLPTDLTDDAAVDELSATVKALFEDQLDVLVHCAGVYARGSTASAAVDQLDRMYAANVRGPYRLTQHLLPALLHRRGQVVLVGSTQALKASGNVGQFAATQHAVRAIADSLRDEINDDGVRVLTLYVGRTATTRQEAIFAAEGRAYEPALLLQPSDVAKTIACCITLPRTAEVTDLTIRPAIKLP
jgi:NADP-dependent 3-hydroxy acid dehydrogenase YdfG